MQQVSFEAPGNMTNQITTLGTLGGKQVMSCDAVSIYTWFQHHKLDLKGHMYTKAYHNIITQIDGLNIILNNLFIYQCETTQTIGWVVVGIKRRWHHDQTGGKREFHK